MSHNIPSPHGVDDDDASFSLSSTPTAGPSQVPRNPAAARSVSRGSAAARSPETSMGHLQQGTGYFAPASPSTSYNRASSPPSMRRRNNTVSSSRYGRITSGTRVHRSTSVSTMERGSAADDGDDEDEDDENGDNHSKTPRAGEGDDEDVPNDPPIEDREFTEEDPLTLKERQSMINVEHPFGLPIWKPALYKKSRTVTRQAETEVHAVPKAVVERHFMPGNVFWAVVFGWWLSLAILVPAVMIRFLPCGGKQYGKLLLGLSWYIVWPFGKYVEGDLEEKHEDQPSENFPPEEDGDDPSAPSTVRRQSPILESANENDSPPTATSGVPFKKTSTVSTITPNTAHLPFHQPTSSWNSDLAHERTDLLVNSNSSHVKTYGIASSLTDPTRAKEAAYWLGKIAFWLAFICLIAPLLLVITLICWGLVVTIPMAKHNWELLTHLWRRPLSIRFCSAPPPTPQLTPQRTLSGEVVMTAQESSPRLTAGQIAPTAPGSSAAPASTVLLCTYRAAGLRYYKYTVGGVNIMFVNLLPVVFCVILDGLILLPIAERRERLGRPLTGLLGFIAGRGLVFVMSLLSVIPLSYFIGMAVASISAQSSIGMGAVINATFGSIIEIILYGIALKQGKGLLVEGSIVGSLLAGVLLMPGLSMIGGAVRKKEQKFNAKSAGVTSTMLIMAIIGVLTPTLFYQTYGNFQLICDGCPVSLPDMDASQIPWKCSHCYYEHPDPTQDLFYQTTVKQFGYFCAGILLLSYLIGLWFSLRTHASQIWQNPQQLMHPLPLDFGAVNVPNRMSLYHRLAQANLTGTLPMYTGKLARKASQATTLGGGGGGGVQRPQSPNPGGGGMPPIHAPQPQRYPQPILTNAGTSAVPPNPAGSTSPTIPRNHSMSSSWSSANLPVPTVPAPLGQPSPGGGYTPFFESVSHGVKSHAFGNPPPMSYSASAGAGPAPPPPPQAQLLPPNLTTDDFTRAVAEATVSALRHQQAQQAQQVQQGVQQLQAGVGSGTSPMRVRVSGTDPACIGPVAGGAPGHGGVMAAGGGGHGGHDGHDAPSWSRAVSASVLLGCTFLYAIIAEILVDAVDVALEGTNISEKFLGITLFALVPNTTEFMNAISFALNGNIALSMEIGSAYALQVCLLQIPAMIAFSAWYAPKNETAANTFTLIFPRWDVIAIILAIFLLTYTYIEAKANYHRGSILTLSYIVLGAGFYYAPPATDVQQFSVKLAANLTGPSASFLKSVQSFLFAR